MAAHFENRGRCKRLLHGTHGRVVTRPPARSPPEIVLEAFLLELEIGRLLACNVARCSRKGVNGT
jgi:hypothetical protein